MYALIFFLFICISSWLLPSHAEAWLANSSTLAIPPNSQNLYLDTVEGLEVSDLPPPGQVTLEPKPLTLSPQGPSLVFEDRDVASESVADDSIAQVLSSDGVPRLNVTVPILKSATVDRHIQFFSYHIRDRFEQWLSRLERYRPAVQGVFSEFQLPLDLVFLSLVESGFNTNAVSRAKAVGPWQFMKQTAKSYGLRVDSWVDERRDPVKSTIAAAQYLRDLYQLFGSWPLAMAAYNAGEGKVGRSLARAGEDSDFWDLTDTKLLRAETKNYVPRFLAAVQIAKDPERYGFTILPQPPMEYEEVALHRPVHLKAAAKAAGVTFEEMKTLNPELKRDMTPPDPLYFLKVPVGTTDTLLANLPTYQAQYPAVYRGVTRASTTVRPAHIARRHYRHKHVSQPKARHTKTAFLAKAIH